MKDLSRIRTRSDVRNPFYSPVEISWQTQAGETKTARAECLDLSTHGARIQCRQPLEIHSTICLRAPGRGLMGNASVRYCLRTGFGYLVGVAFFSAASQADEGRKRCLLQSQAETERKPAA
jgi:PilZ domain